VGEGVGVGDGDGDGEGVNVGDGDGNGDGEGDGVGDGDGDGMGEGDGVGVGVGVLTTLGLRVALVKTGEVTTGGGLPGLWVVGVGSGTGLTAGVAEELAANRVGEGVADKWLASGVANADA
jgi:hypothetical protein